MRLYLVRHGDPDYKHDTLTETGHREAKALGQRFRGEGLTRLYTSPLGRARATLAYTEEATGLKGEVLPWTRELDLNVSPPGTPYLAAWDVPAERIRRRGIFGRRWQDAPRPWATPKVKKAFPMVGRESDAFFGAWGYVREGGRYRIEKANRERIAVFCHGGFGLTWLAHLLDIPLAWMYAGFFLPPTSVTTILFDERTPSHATPRCIGLGDLSHLHAAGLPMSPSGLKANVD